MGAFLKRRQATGLIVCLAIVLQWFAPAWASAALNTASPPWAAEVCRSNSVPAPAQAPAASHSLKHCLFCASSSDTPAPPASPLGISLPPAGTAPPPVLAAEAALAVRHWHPALPRAPPMLA